MKTPKQQFLPLFFTMFLLALGGCKTLTPTPNEKKEEQSTSKPIGKVVKDSLPKGTIPLPKDPTIKPK